MIGRHQNRMTMAFAGVFAAILAFNAFDAYDILLNKRDDQAKAFAQFDRYSKSYRALLPVKASWSKLYAPAGHVRDVYSIYKLIDPLSAGLTAVPDAMTIGLIERVTSNGKELGLTALCPKSGGHTGFYVSAPSTAEMLAGIRKLTDRIDILVKDISLTTTGGKVSADLSLCLLVRDGE